VNIELYKRRLRAEERRLSESIERGEANGRDLNDGAPTGDWTDASVRDEEEDAEFQEADRDSATLKLVWDALQRIEDGNFGKCLVDGGTIEEKRLQAMPWTPYCLKHEQLLEMERPRGMPTL
jgi:DnaK suppressor protein